MNLCSWHHRFAHVHIRELKYSLDQLTFSRFDMSTLLRDVDQVTQLVFGINGSMFPRRLSSKQAHSSYPCPIKKPYWPTKGLIERLHRPGDRQRHLLCSFQSQCFGCEFSEDNMQKSYDRECYRKSYRVKRNVRDSPLERCFEYVGEYRLADPPEGERSHRDTQLCC